MSSTKQFAFCKICRLNHNKGKGHKYSLNHKKYLAQVLAKFHKNIEEVVFFLRNPMLLRPQDKHRNKFWCVVCEKDIDETHSSLACCNAIKHLTSSEHMVCLKSFWLENGADVQKRDKYCICQQEFAKWENRCRYFERTSITSGGSSYEDLNNIHSKRSSVNMDTFGNVSINTIANNLSDNVLPLQHFKDKSFQVSGQGDRASVAHLVSQDAHLLILSERIIANQEPLWKHSQLSKHMHSLSKNGLIQAGAAAGDSVAQKNSVSTTSASSGQPCSSNFPRHEEGYNVASSLQDGYQGIQHHLTCIRAPALFPEEAKENIHTGAPPPWLKMDGENDVIFSGTSADIQRLSKTQERKLKKMRNPKRVGAAWAEQRRAELERELNGETSCTNVANDSSWLPNFGRVWQAGSRKDSRKEFEAEKNIEKTFVMTTENMVELQPYISKRMRVDPKVTNGD